MESKKIISFEKKYVSIVFLIFSIMIFSTVSAADCNSISDDYKNYFIEILGNADLLHQIYNELAELNNNNITYNDTILIDITDKNWDSSKKSFSINIDSAINFDDMNLSTFPEDPLSFLEYLSPIKINNQPLNTTRVAFDTYYAIFKSTSIFQIVKDLNITQVSFNGTYYDVNSDTENIKNIFHSLELSEKLQTLNSDNRTFDLDFDITIDNSCNKSINLNFNFTNDNKIIISTELGGNYIEGVFYFDDNLITFTLEYSGLVVYIESEFDGNSALIRGGIGSIDSYNDIESIKLNNSYGDFIINVSNDNSSKINVSGLIDSTGKTIIPKITINSDKMIVNIPACTRSCFVLY